jgi:mRNA interferase RelE/StbE
MAYRLEISKAAQKDLSKLDHVTLIDIRQRLERLAEDADDIRHLALKGDLSGLYKLRIGKYRVIYDLRTDIQVIVVIRAGKRSDVYRPKN